jgi:hypothetical protein
MTLSVLHPFAFPENISLLSLDTRPSDSGLFVDYGLTEDIK